MKQRSTLAINIDTTRPLGGRFEVLRCLGVGSLGAVYLVTDNNDFHRPLALKVLIPVKGDVESVTQRFRSEVEISQRLDHPRIIKVLEYIETSELTAYTMDFLAGGDLHRMIKEERLPDIANAIRMLAELCEGLISIHDKGIIHRDLKPENILLSETHHICISDFGVAKNDEGPCFTSPGGIVGTIDYQSPEYLEHNESSRKGDIYSVGCIAYELVTGQLPFAAESVFRSIERKLNDTPVAPHALNSRCPLELSQWILGAMERDPSKREGSIHKLRDALRPLEAKHPAAQLPEEVLLANERVLRLLELAKANKPRGVISRLARYFSRQGAAEGRSH